jgi:hypothetical protein
MKTVACIFDILNDDSGELLLYFEPEGNEFRLPPGKAVQVRLFGNVHPVEMRHSSDMSGRRAISFWPERGGFELVLDGKSVWEQA